jgi:hypothetical protein
MNSAGTACKVSRGWRPTIGLIAVSFVLLLLFFCAARTNFRAGRSAYSIMTELTVQRMDVPGGGLRCTMLRDGVPMTYMDAFRALESNELDCSRILTEVIVEFPAAALFWECIPVTASTAPSKIFEFVLLASDALANIETDIRPFREKFEQHARESFRHPSHVSGTVVAFHNLNQDAVLVVPVPTSAIEFKRPPAHFAHLAAFMRGAPSAHISAFWSTVGAAALNQLRAAEGQGNADKKFWLSTSGLGVSWLHVRIDTVPKYYNFAAYKNG